MLFVLASICFSLAGVSERPDVEKYEKSLRSLSDSASGRRIKVKGSVTVLGRDTTSKFQVQLEFVDKDPRVAILRRVESKVAPVFGSDGVVSTVNSWMYLTPSMQFTRKVSTRNRPEGVRDEWHRAYLNIEPRSVLPLGNAAEICGYYPAMGMFWYEALDDKDARIRVLEKEHSCLVSSEKPESWKFEFSFDHSSPPRLLSAKIENLSTPPDSGAFQKLFHLKQIKIGESERGPIIEAIGEMDVLMFGMSNGNVQEVRSSQRRELVENDEISPALTDKIQFSDITIADGTPVRVGNDKGIPYEFRNGFVVKVVDKGRIIATDEARFRKARGVGWIWYLVFGSLAIVFTVFLFWSRGDAVK